MRFFKHTLFACLLALSAQASDALLNSLQPRGLVNDYADVMSDGEEARLNGMLTELQQKTGAEVAVVTLPSLNGGQIDDFSVRLYERWGIGQKGKDNGILLLAAIEDRNARIEVGYGLEGTIPDGRAGRILRNEIFPSFKQRRYGEGLTAGATRIASLIASEQGAQLTGVPQHTTRRGSGSQSQRKSNPLLSLIFIIGFIYMAIRHPRLLLLLMIMGGRGGGRSSGGFGGGGFGGFGGGMSGGGGASGGW